MKQLTVLLILLTVSLGTAAQNSMGIGTETPNPNAVLEIVSPGGNQGVLIPRYDTNTRTSTAFTDNLSDTDNGLMVYDITEGALYFWYFGQWVPAANQTFTELLAESADAGGQNINNLADPVNEQDAATKAYVDSAAQATWTLTDTDLSYNAGFVGVGTDNPLSPLQVEGRLQFFHLQIEESEIDGRIIADNLYYDGTTLRNVEDGTISFMFMSSTGEIEFLHGDTAVAGTDRFEEIETSLTLRPNRHAEFRGAVEIGDVQDSMDISSGMLAYNGTSLYLYNGVEWRDIAGTGPTSIIDGDLGIGELEPSAKLDVVGDTELNGRVTTTHAVYSNTVTETGSRAVEDTDHIIALEGTGNQTITLPDASSNTGRELIFMYTATTIATHTISTSGTDTFLFEANTPTSIDMSNSLGSIVSMTLRAVGDKWFVVHTVLSTSA